MNFIIHPRKKLEENELFQCDQQIFKDILIQMKRLIL